jgi:flagellin FlaB
MFTKRGLVSLETLVIFIAVILIAALSAGVLIRNSGILSQRAYSVSEESRERLVSGVDILSLSGEANITAETINDLEILLRLKAGSYPVQLKNLRLMFSSQGISTGGSLQHSSVVDSYSDIDLTSINGTESFVSDIESNTLDGSQSQEKISVVTIDDASYVRVNLSYASNHKDVNNPSPAVVDIPLGANINASGVAVDVLNEKIVVSGMVYGFVTVNGVLHNDSLSNATQAILTNFPYGTDHCSFDNLIPEKRFCMNVDIGDSDTTLETGELITLRYRFADNLHELNLEQDYELRLIPKEGAIESLKSKLPSTVVVERTTLYG